MTKKLSEIMKEASTSEPTREEPAQEIEIVEKKILTPKQPKIPAKKQELAIMEDFQYIPSKEIITESMSMYKFLMKTIINKSDYHKKGSAEYLKRSGYNKIAQAFGITTEQVGKEEIYDVNGDLHARVHIRASLGHIDSQAIEIAINALVQSGKVDPRDIIDVVKEMGKIRHADGVGIVSISEIKFEGNKTQHNLIAHAFTRARCRAIADLVGLGVVSAAEVNQEFEDDDTDSIWNK